MRITSKGQVTIPIEIREKAGLLPHMDIEFHLLDDGSVNIQKSSQPTARGSAIVERMRQAKPSNDLTTDEIMALFRGEDL
jgi:bifunctional DNA-binding transcriptional regulator/antitoxin component of YhaV-PrlF toxin-antitoxin module